MGKLIIDIDDINYFGNEKISDSEDNYDIVGRRVARFLREEMEHTMKKYIIVEVE